MKYIIALLIGLSIGLASGVFLALRAIYTQEPSSD